MYINVTDHSPKTHGLAVDFIDFSKSTLKWEILPLLIQNRNALYSVTKEIMFIYRKLSRLLWFRWALTPILFACLSHLAGGKHCEAGAEIDKKILINFCEWVWQEFRKLLEKPSVREFWGLFKDVLYGKASALGPTSYLLDSTTLVVAEPGDRGSRAPPPYF